MSLLIRMKYLGAALTLLLLIAACGPAIPHDATATPEPTATTATSEVVIDATRPPPPLINGGAGQQWDSPPPMVIEPDRIYQATFRTEKGDVIVELFADRAPITVNNLVFLAREGYYDGTTFHRVLDNFMAQGGDPTGTGMGGPGYRFADEIVPTLSFDEPGYLAMANSGPVTNGSQFFITFAPTPWLDGQHTIFGKVVGGMAVLDDLTRRDPNENPDFEGDVLETIIIEEINESALPPPPPTPVPVVPVIESGRPLASLDSVERENLYTAPPAMVIDTSLAYAATIVTTQGEIIVRLYPQDAPESVNNFYVLAELGYWDNFPIVFADPLSFVITGSPAGQPDSDVGYTLPSELGRTNSAGAVGFYFDQNRRASSGSQFYILLQDGTEMDMLFTVFGEVMDGMDVAQALTTEDLILTITVEPLATE